MIKRLIAAATLALTGGLAMASPLDGDKTIYLVSVEGERTAIGDISFAPDGDASTYTIAMREEPFADHFLSMRPFKCLEGPAKHWCFVPYPYEIKRKVSADDLTDLEYDLLFIWKGATEYGINMWNGVYYRLEIEGDKLVGRLHEMDMDILSAPPDDGDLRPVGEYDVEESDPESHWLPVVVVE